MQQNGQLPSDSDDRPFLRVAAAAVREGKPKASEVTLGPERPEDILCRTHQEASTKFIARFEIRNCGCEELLSSRRGTKPK